MMRQLVTNKNWIKMTLFAVVLYFPIPSFSDELSFSIVPVMVETATIEGGYCKEYGGTKFPFDLGASGLFKNAISRELKVVVPGGPGGSRRQVILAGYANFYFGRGSIWNSDTVNGDKLNLPPTSCGARLDGPLKNGNLELEAQCKRGLEFNTQARCEVQLRDVRDCFYETDFSSTAQFEVSKVTCIQSSKEDREAYRKAYIDYWSGRKK